MSLTASSLFRSNPLVHTPHGWVIACECCNGGGDVTDWRDFHRTHSCGECDGVGTWDATPDDFDNDEFSLDGRFVSTEFRDGKLIAFDADGEEIGPVDYDRLRPLAECVA